MAERKIGPFLRVKTVDVRGLDADITISCSNDPDTIVLVTGTFFRIGRVHAHRSLGDRGPTLTLVNRNDPIQPVDRRREREITPNQSFLHSSQRAPVVVKLFVLEGTCVLY